MKCRFCHSEKTIKAGTIRNKQRYQCKKCHIHFITDVSPKRIDMKIKLQALVYLKEGMGFRATGRVLGVSFSSVKQWFKNKSRLIQEACDSREVDSSKEIKGIEIEELLKKII